MLFTIFEDNVWSKRAHNTSSVTMWCPQFSFRKISLHCAIIFQANFTASDALLALQCTEVCLKRGVQCRNSYTGVRRLEFAPQCHSFCDTCSVPKQAFAKSALGLLHTRCGKCLSCMQQWSTQVLSLRLKGFSSGSLSSLRYLHQMPLTQFRVLDPSAASALACGMAVEFSGRVSRLDQSIVSGLHVILKCQPYLFRVWIKGFAIAIC